MISVQFVRDSKFGDTVGDLCSSFLKLVRHMIDSRLEQGVNSDECMNFMLSVRLSFHGESLEQISDDWTKIISNSAGALKSESLLDVMLEKEKENGTASR